MQLLQRRCGNHSDYLIRQSKQTYTSEQTQESEQRSSAFNEHSCCLKKKKNPHRESANLFQYLLGPPYRGKSFQLQSFPNYTKSGVPLPHIILFTLKFWLIFTYCHSLLRVKTVSSACTFGIRRLCAQLYVSALWYNTACTFSNGICLLWFYGKFANKMVFSRKIFLLHNGPI